MERNKSPGFFSSMLTSFSLFYKQSFNVTNVVFAFCTISSYCVIICNNILVVNIGICVNK